MGKRKNSLNDCPWLAIGIVWDMEQSPSNKHNLYFPLAYQSLLQAPWCALPSLQPWNTSSTGSCPLLLWFYVQLYIMLKMIPYNNGFIYIPHKQNPFFVSIARSIRMSLIHFAAQGIAQLLRGQGAAWRTWRSQGGLWWWSITPLDVSGS